MGAFAHGGGAARFGFGVTQAVGARTFRILHGCVGRQLHGPADQGGVELEAAVFLVPLARHEGGCAGGVFFRCPAVAQVVVHQPGAPAHVTNGAARRRGARHARDHVVRLAKVEGRVQQNGLHGRGRVDLAHAQYSTTHAVLIAVDGVERAGDVDRGGVLPVALVPVLELACTVACVFANFKHGGDKHLDLYGFGSGRCSGGGCGGGAKR